MEHVLESKPDTCDIATMTVKRCKPEYLRLSKNPVDSKAAQTIISSLLRSGQLQSTPKGRNSPQNYGLLDDNISYHDESYLDYASDRISSSKSSTQSKSKNEINSFDKSILDSSRGTETEKHHSERSSFAHRSSEKSVYSVKDQDNALNYDDELYVDHSGDQIASSKPSDEGRFKSSPVGETVVMYNQGTDAEKHRDEQSSSGLRNSDNTTQTVKRGNSASLSSKGSPQSHVMQNDHVSYDDELYIDYDYGSEKLSKPKPSTDTDIEANYDSKPGTWQSTGTISETHSDKQSSFGVSSSDKSTQTMQWSTNDVLYSYDKSYPVTGNNKISMSIKSSSQANDVLEHEKDNESKSFFTNDIRVHDSVHSFHNGSFIDYHPSLDRVSEMSNRKISNLRSNSDFSKSASQNTALSDQDHSSIRNQSKSFRMSNESSGIKSNAEIDQGKIEDDSKPSSRNTTLTFQDPIDNQVLTYRASNGKSDQRSGTESDQRRREDGFKLSSHNTSFTSQVRSFIDNQGISLQVSNISNDKKSSTGSDQKMRESGSKLSTQNTNFTFQDRSSIDYQTTPCRISNVSSSRKSSAGSNQGRRENESKQNSKISCDLKIEIEKKNSQESNINYGKEESPPVDSFTTDGSKREENDSDDSLTNSQTIVIDSPWGEPHQKIEIPPEFFNQNKSTGLMNKHKKLKANCVLTDVPDPKKCKCVISKPISCDLCCCHCLKPSSEVMCPCSLVCYHPCVPPAVCDICPVLPVYLDNSINAVRAERFNSSLTRTPYEVNVINLPTIGFAEVPPQRPAGLSSNDIWSHRIGTDINNANGQDSRKSSVEKLVGRRPPTIICYICGREYGTASIEIHEKQCLDKWRKENDQLPKGKQRIEPVKPQSIVNKNHRSLSSDIKISGSGKSDYNLDTINEAAFEVVESQYVKCEKCGRTFFPDRLSIHKRNCRGFHKIAFGKSEK